MSVYVGPDSAYAKREGAYVPGSGVSRETVGGLVALIIRDYRRGWGYDKTGRKQRVGRATALKRLRYLIALSKRHSGSTGFVRRVVEQAVRSWRVPRGVAVRLAGPNAARVARELARRGIASADQIRVREGRRVAA